MAARNNSTVESHHLAQGLNIWHRYDSTVKADLFSTAIATDSGTLLVDPIELGDEELPGTARIAGIVVTNANHLRASDFFSAKFSAPIYATRDAEVSSATEVGDGQLIGDLRIIGIDGAAPGEIALFSERDHGLLVIGDALINFGSHGFTFLPAKYCLDSKLMRKSLRKLLDLDFSRMVFAHGTPIMSQARDRLAALLSEQ
jgi:glyoxylase-like metal-dependent hydrolase (beta-lactamase superfamily II)